MIVRVAKRRRFTVVDNRALDDEGLSFRAVGLLVYLLSKPDDWTVNTEHLCRQHKEGREAVRTTLVELEEAGYLTRMRLQDDKGHWVWACEVHEEPVEDESAGQPIPQEPDDGNPGTGNPTTETRDPETRRLSKDVEANTENQSLNKKTSVADGLDDARRLCDLLAESIAERGSKRPSVTTAWVTDMDRLIRLDKRTPVQIEKTLHWLAKGDDRVSAFWQVNIRSPQKLRLQWDRMREQFESVSKNAQTNGRGGNYFIEHYEELVS